MMPVGVRSMPATQIFIDILYDRDAAGDETRAQACHDLLLAQLAGRWLPPQRLGIQRMARLSLALDIYAAVVPIARAAIDGDRLLCPDPYEFAGATARRINGDAATVLAFEHSLLSSTFRTADVNCGNPSPDAAVGRRLGQAAREEAARRAGLRDKSGKIPVDVTLAMSKESAVQGPRQWPCPLDLASRSSATTTPPC